MRKRDYLYISQDASALSATVFCEMYRHYLPNRGNTENKLCSLSSPKTPAGETLPSAVRTRWVILVFLAFLFWLPTKGSCIIANSGAFRRDTEFLFFSTVSLLLVFPSENMAQMEHSTWNTSHLRRDGHELPPKPKLLISWAGSWKDGSCSPLTNWPWTLPPITKFTGFVPRSGLEGI